MRAMILAAGRGARMRPLTDSTPKPLLEAGGRPLIEHLIDRLAAAGIDQLIINLGWLGDQIEQALGDGGRLGVTIEYSREPPGALETAGGIIHALPLLGQAPFVVANSDLWCDYPFTQLAAPKPGIDAHLVLVDNPEHHPEGDFALTGKHVELAGPNRLTYSGIAVLRPTLFDGYAPGVRPLRPVLETAIADGRVSGEHYRGHWADIGNPERLAALDQALRTPRT
ncbi:MAG: nucleotidyltransferase family protein [Wenzhouxiangellaceae bacterium]|nr:nucleotidyltransferase family protein [Wenzhouxiangellaceae bacterium]